MTRQEAVIKIVKITRIIGELKYQLDADDEVEFEALDPEWKHIAEWTQEVCRYMELDASPQVARLIANIGFTDMVEKYVQSCRKEIGAKEAKTRRLCEAHANAVVVVRYPKRGAEGEIRRSDRAVSQRTGGCIAAKSRRCGHTGPTLPTRSADVPPATESHRLCGVEPMQTAQPVCPV